MVWMADCGSRDLRSNLGIPTQAFVYGWVGGDGSWDPIVTAIVREVAVALGAKVFFLFQNFPHDQAILLSDVYNVILLDAENDAYFKCLFGQTMNVFLHTRVTGETFGLAVAEVRVLQKIAIAILSSYFLRNCLSMQVSLLQRPTLTSGLSKDQAHIQILQPDIYLYRSYDELKDLMLILSRDNVMQADFAAHYEQFSPAKVMAAFNDKFLDGKLVPRLGASIFGQRFDPAWLTLQLSGITSLT